jgi:hypothetical protein
MRTRPRGGSSGDAASGHGVIARLNAAIDTVVEWGLSLVAHRLNKVVEAVDRVDGGTGRGLAIASAMAWLAGFEVREVREEREAIASSRAARAHPLPRTRHEAALAAILRRQQGAAPESRTDHTDRTKVPSASLN